MSSQDDNSSEAKMAPILFKGFLSLFASLIAILLLKSGKAETMSDRGFLSLILLVNSCLGFLFFFAIYVVSGLHVTSDVPGYYVPAAQQALAGRVPYRDFETSYGPLFPYMGAALLLVWNSPKAFVIFALILNSLSLLTWHRIANSYCQQSIARTASLFYCTSGHTLVQCLLGTNQIWIASGVAASVLLIHNRRSAASGVAQAVAICVTKIIAGLYWPLLFVAAPNRLRWLLNAVVPLVVVCAFFMVYGADILYPLKSEGALISSGNLPYLLEPLIPLERRRLLLIFDCSAAIALAITFGLLCTRSWNQHPSERVRLLLPHLAFITLVFLLLSKKSFTGYAVFCMYPIGLVIALSTIRQRGKILLLTGFNFLLAIEPSVWFHLRGNGLSLSEWQLDSSPFAISVFVSLDVCLVILYSVLAYMSYRCALLPIGGVSAEMPTSLSSHEPGDNFLDMHR
jgi:hypothetical protein